MDLDFFVFRPGPDGLILPDEEHAIYWGMQSHPEAGDLSWSPNSTIDEAFIRLEVTIQTPKLTPNKLQIIPKNLQINSTVRWTTSGWLILTNKPST